MQPVRTPGQIFRDHAQKFEVVDSLHQTVDVDRFVNHQPSSFKVNNQFLGFTDNESPVAVLALVE